jgi:hypothetical protein
MAGGEDAGEWGGLSQLSGHLSIVGDEFDDFRHRSLQDLGPAADVVRLRTTRHPSAHSLPGSLDDRRIRQK